jgi:hypothetical protein
MSRIRQMLFAGTVVLVLVAGLVFEIVWTAPVRGAVGTFSRLLTIVNRPDLKPEERITAAESLCTGRYLISHKLAVAADGQGLVGIPRNLNKNFKAWCQGPFVWICPTNRVGPIYQFAFQDQMWRFDGPVGILRPWGEIVPMTDAPDLE